MDDNASQPLRAPPPATLRRVVWAEDLAIVRRLFQEYRGWLAHHGTSPAEEVPTLDPGLSLVDRLIAGLPGTYSPPEGDVLLWYHDGTLIACGALRELEPGVGEIKRLYIRPDYRGKTFGLTFVRALMDRARQLGYRKLRADTLPSMQAAIEFYEELGFRRVSAYWPHPAAGALFFERKLEP